MSLGMGLTCGGWIAFAASKLSKNPSDVWPIIGK
jgi:hypothetical protein